VAQALSAAAATVLLRVFFFGGVELEPKLLGWRDQRPQSPLFRHGIRRTSQYSLQETLGDIPHNISNDACSGLIE
jgi:hypothetical protein